MRKMPQAPFGKIPLPRPKDPCAKVKKEMRVAAAIVSQVLVHFGAGCGAPNGQIFQAPSDLAIFSNLLLTSTLKSVANGNLQWETDQPTRDYICGAAYQHGVRARAMAGNSALTIVIIMDTLREIQAILCPPGAGGGPVCEF